MNLIELESSLRQLRLGGMAAVLETRLRQAQAESMAPLDLIASLVNDELTRRSDRLLERRRKQAQFRDPDKGLDNFDFNFNPKMNRSLVFDLATCAFLSKREDALFLGPGGTGKSHLAQPIGRAAIQQGYRVIYRETHVLLDDLAEAVADGTRREFMESLTTVPLLIIDLCEVFRNVELSAGRPAGWPSSGGTAPHLCRSIGKSPSGDESNFAEVPMLHSLLPKAHAKTLALPLLGSIADGFDDWLAVNGYTAGSRRYAIRMLPHLDNDLRKRKVRTVSELTHATLHASWRHLIKRFPMNAGTVRSLERYLTATGTMADIKTIVAQSAAEKLSDEYAYSLREVRGFAIHSVANHRRVSQAFLDHLDRRRVPLWCLQAKDIEVFVSQAGKRLCRGSLQHEIAALRGLLRFLALDGRVPSGLDKRIDTPRLYRLEQLPRALPWPTVIELLKSLDLTSDIGLRDYAMFLLIATYGLRASEVVELTLDDVAWRKGVLHIHQSKTGSPLELPLTNEVATALTKHLKRSTPPARYRRIFLRKRAPIGVLKPTAVTEAFQALVRHSKLDVPFQGPHCLRHSLAVHLLKNGTPLKTIGDILGHRTAESTSMYLRLATGDLRGVSLSVPGKGTPVKEVRP